MEYPVVKLQAKKQNELLGNSQVIYCYELPDIIHLELPVWAKPFELVDMFEIGSEIEERTDIVETVTRAPHNIWVDIPQESLDTKPGYHKYRVRLSNDEIVVTLYFDYTIESCHPDKPYVYMDHKECACSG